MQTDILSVSHNFLKIFCICRCCQLNGQYETELFSLSLLHILSSCFVFGDVVSLVVSVRLSYFSFQLLHILSSCFVFGDVVSLVVSVRLSYFSFHLLHILSSCFVFGDVVSLMVCKRLSYFSFPLLVFDLFCFAWLFCQALVPSPVPLDQILILMQFSILAWLNFIVIPSSAQTSLCH